MINTITLQEFEQKLENKEAFVVDFYADWCQSCIEMMPTVEEVAHESTVPFYKVNVDNQPEMKEKCRIKAIPMLMYYKGGRPMEFLYGKNEKQKVIQKLNRIG